MTKGEFKDAFKRLRVAGYRLPLHDGVTVDDVMNEWFQTFGNCSAKEMNDGIDLLKRIKTDTFWPAPGELWAQIFEVRRARRIRLSASMPDYDDPPEHVRQEMASMFREFAKQLSAKMTMKRGAPVQEEPDHILLEREDREREESA